VATPPPRQFKSARPDHYFLLFSFAAGDACIHARRFDFEIEQSSK
jgi:hypothetical protein